MRRPRRAPSWKVSLTALYDKVNHTEPEGGTRPGARVRREAGPGGCTHGDAADAVGGGHRMRVLDGNHTAAMKRG